MPFDSVFGIISNLGTYIGRLFILFTVYLMPCCAIRVKHWKITTGSRLGNCLTFLKHSKAAPKNNVCWLIEVLYTVYLLNKPRTMADSLASLDEGLYGPFLFLEIRQLSYNGTRRCVSLRYLCYFTMNILLIR